MHRLLLSIFTASLLALPAYAQDADSEDNETTPPEVAEQEESEVDSELDEQGYAEENEDDFDPSQDVAADQSLAFPTDI